MENSQKKYLAIAAVVILIVAAIGIAWYMTKDNDNDKERVSFLVQDHEGVYFWVEGTTTTEGTVLDAFENAMDSFKFDFERSNGSYGEGIQSIFGIETKKVGENYLWWSQYYWGDDGWKSFEKMIGNEKASGYDSVAIVYGDGTNAPKAEPKDAVNISTDMSGLKFLIQSQSGLYFYISGNGDNAKLALSDATNTYKVPISIQESGWIDSIFGLKTYQNDAGDYIYWVQYHYEDNAWVLNDKTLSEVPVTYDYIAIHYSDASSKPVTPL